MTERYFTARNLLEAPVHRAAYSDRTSYLMAQCSQLAYLCEEPKALKAGLADGGFDLVAVFKGANHNNAFLATSKKHGMAVLAFKGTVLSEWGTVKTDLDFSSYRTVRGTFHEGFLRAFQSMEGQVLKAWAKVDQPLYLTGHSLGGALAVVAAMNIRDTDWVAACYTYGAPRVCDLATVIKFYKIPVYRMVHQDDIVPCLPPPFMSRGYVQIGDVRFINDQNEEIEGSAGVWQRIWTQVKANLSFRFGRLVGDHSISEYGKILERIAEARLNDGLKGLIREERIKAGGGDPPGACCD